MQILPLKFFSKNLSGTNIEFYLKIYIEFDFENIKFYIELDFVKIKFLKRGILLHSFQIMGKYPFSPT